MNEKPSCMRDVINNPESHKLSSEIESVVESFFRCRSLFHPGESEAFNPFLNSVFTLSEPPAFVGDMEEVRRAHFNATVLYRISREACGTASNPENHPIGWLGLNLDAKGWCILMLKCHAPPDMTVSALHELIRAKSIVARLIVEDGLLPMVARDPLIPINEEVDLLDKPMDE